MLLGRLAVCVGGFDLSAAEAVGAGGAIDTFDIDDALARLVDKSLVHATDRGDATRYKMLETIREYALDRLDAGSETADARTRHASYYVDFARRAGAGLKGPEERVWLQRVEDELDNLRAAVTWSIATGDTQAACWCVCALGLQGLRIEPAVSSWADGVVACEAARTDPEYAAVLAVAAWARMGEGRSEDALQLCDAALEHLHQTPAAPVVECRVAASIAGIGPQVGRDPTSHALQWLHAGEEAGDDYEIALAINIAAIGQYMAGDPGALTTAEESLRTARRSRSPTAIAYCCFTTAMICGEHEPARALGLLDESQRSAEVAANTFALITVTAIRCNLLSRAGEHRAAATAYIAVAEDAFRYGRREQQANALFGVAASLAALGQAAPATVILGWIESLMGSLDNIIRLSFSGEAGAAAARLPDDLGHDRYASLHAEGVAMTAEEILEYAREHIEQEA
jgi:hypothetical protein